MEKIFLDHPWIIALVLLWTLPWKAAALWRSARRSHLGWFLTLIILNTLGILDLLYIFVFSSWGLKKKEEQQKQQQDEQQEQPPVRQASHAKFSSGSKSRTTIV